jgi:hypothetical protein
MYGIKWIVKGIMMKNLFDKRVFCLLFVLMNISCAMSNEITQKDAQIKITEQQKRWALATTAVLTESNKAEHDLLGGSDPTPEMSVAWRESLVSWWDIHNRKELIETLKWIDHGGHRKNFDEFSRVLFTATPEQLVDIKARAAVDPDVSHKIDVVLQYGEKFGNKSITAWDYSRYISLCGWGYIAGYLTENEAWGLIMPVAQFLQNTFDSWEDIGLNYVVGRQFWSLEQTQKRGILTEQSYRFLLTDFSSPWQSIPWSLDLTNVVH